MCTKLIFVFLSVIVLANGQVTFFGKCPTVTTQQNFNIPNYLGLWYETKRYEAIFQLGGECVTAEYTLNQDNTVGVNNSMINILGQFQTISGTAREANPGANDGKLLVKFPNQPFDGSYWVLGTDYTSYSVVWSCTPIGPINLQFAWVLSRTKTMSDASKQAVATILDNNKIKTSPFRQTKQDCNNTNFNLGNYVNSVLSFTRNLIPRI